MRSQNLTFSDRWMFNRVMCEEDVCRRVLRAILGFDIGRIEYLNAEQAIEPAAASRGVRMDVFARTAGSLYNVEMQTYRRKNLGRRMRYYQASMDVEVLRRGKPYDLLPESYLAIICDFDPFGARAPLYTFEIACRECGDVALGHGFHWLVLNASAWSELPEGPLRNLLQYVATGEVGDDGLVRRIARAVQKGNEDAPWKERAMQILTYEEDLAMQRDMILREGLNEGRAEGRIQGRAEGCASERERYGALVRVLLAANRQDDLLRAAEDPSYLEELYLEFCL